MNILIANWTWYPSGGDWTTIENLIKIYERKGHNITPFSMHDERNYHTSFDKYFIEKIDYKELNKNKTFNNSFKVLKKSIYSIEAKKNLEKLIQGNKVDLAHLHNIHRYLTPSILPVLKKNNIPIIWTLHDYGMLCPNTSFTRNGEICEECINGKFINCTIHKCKKNSYLASFVASMEAYTNQFLNIRKFIDFFICPSKFLYNKFLEYGYEKSKLIYINNPFDIRTLEKSFTKSNINYEKYILYIGRIEEIKGVFTLVKAMETIRDINLLIIGSGTKENALKEFVAKKNLNNIFFLGKLERESVLNYINYSMFTICPSEWYENMPYSIIEVMLLGKCVIGSKIGGIPELVISDYTGLLFEPGNHNELKEKILYLVNNRKKYVELGVNAKNHVSALVDMDNYYKKMQEIFNKLKLQKI